MPRRAAKLAACLSLGALALSAMSFEADLRARGAVLHALAGARGLAIASLSANPFRGRLTVCGIAAEAGSVRVSIGALTLPTEQVGLGWATTAHAADGGKVTANDVAIVDGTTTYHIKHIELVGTTLTNVDLAALLDPKSGETLEARLRKLTASAITIPEIAADSIVGATEQHWTQKQILLADVRAGKAANASAGMASLATTDGKTASNLEIGGLQLTSVDLGQIAHVFGAARTDSTEPLLPLYDTVVANAVKLTDVSHNQVFSIGAVHENGVRGRAFSGGLRARSVELAQAKPNDPAANAFLQDFLRSVAVGSIEIDDIASVPPPAGAAIDTNFHVARIAAKDVGGGSSIGELELQDLRFFGQQGTVRLASAKAGPITFPISPDPAEVSVPTLDRLDAAGLNVDVNTADNGQPAQRLAFAVERMSYAAPGFTVGRLPPKATMSIGHLGFDIPQNGQAAPLRELGYTHLDVSSDLASSYDASREVLTIDKFAIGEVEMGSLALKLDLGNVSDKLVSQNPAIQQASMIAVLFKGADLVVRNGDLVDKTLRYNAAQAGKSVDEERQSLIETVTKQLPAQLGDPPKLKSLTTALARFIAAPKSLHVAITTRNGLGAADAALLGDPLALLDQLDIQASANE